MPNSPIMSGMATLTMVEDSTVAMQPVITAAVAHHL